MAESIIEITNNKIQLDQLLQATSDTRTGAVVVFLGIARGQTGNRRTERLEYEAHEQMALAKLQELWQQASQQWSLLGGGIIHRTGTVMPGEISVAIVVATEHRAQAFEAARWIIEQIKKVVPIWKKECWADGSVEWVHPGWEHMPYCRGENSP